MSWSSGSGADHFFWRLRRRPSKDMVEGFDGETTPPFMSEKYVSSLRDGFR